MKKFISIAVLSVILIFAACKSGSKLDRTHAPAAGPAPKIQIGNYQIAELSNGLKLIVVENHKLPRVSYGINLDIDPILEGTKSGAASFAGDLMTTGTTTKTKSQIDEAVDFLGASLNSSSTYIGGNCLKKHSDEFLALLSDVLLNPSFSEDELEKARKQALSSLSSEKTDPDALSGKITSVMRYGKDHPYGEQLSEESLNNIKREDLLSYYNTYVKPNVAYLVVVGDITFEEAKASSEKYFSSWKKGDVKKNSYKQPQAPKGNRVIFVPVPGAVQSVISVTYPIDVKPGTQEAITASVLDNILGGGGFQSRLMQNLREDKAYTYGAYSDINSDKLIGSFSAGASVRNAVTDSAVTQILLEMNRLVNEPVADSTLKLIKNIMTGTFARSLERPQTVANFALNIQMYKLPSNYYETYLEKLNAVTAADIQALAKKVILPSNAYITIVGNKDIADKLAPFAASKKVELMNADGTEFADIKPVPAGVTLESVFNKYIDARGGKKALEGVKSIEQTGKMNMQGMALDVLVKMKDSDKFKMSVSMGGQELMQQVVNGAKGSMSQMGMKEAMDEAMVAETKIDADLLAVLNYAKYGATAALIGLDKVNNEDAYVVEVTKKDGTKLTDYYSVASGLKIKSLSVSSAEEGGMTSESLYQDYTMVSGVSFPMKLVQSADNQQMVFTFSETKLNQKIDDKEFVVE
jgi:zinc protease